MVAEERVAISQYLDGEGKFSLPSGDHSNGNLRTSDMCGRALTSSIISVELLSPTLKFSKLDGKIAEAVRFDFYRSIINLVMIESPKEEINVFTVWSRKLVRV